MKSPTLVRCLLAAIAAAILPCFADGAAPTWKAGVSRGKITPPAGMWMTGYGTRDRPADGTAQDLWVKALAISDPAGNRGVILTADLCGITRAISDRVAGELARRHGLERSAVMTNVSHTHCAPWIDGFLTGMRILPPEEEQRTVDYRLSLEKTMIEVGTRALESLAPATLSWGEDATDFGINRRENPEPEAPARRAAGTLKGPVDSRVPVLAVRSPDGALSAVLVSYACHNTTLQYFLWHGDYAGCAQLELERRHAGATALFAMGCGADINPNPRRTVELAEQHGRALADAADRALASPMKTISGSFGTAFADVTLRFARLPTEDELQAAPEKDRAKMEAKRAWSRALGREIREKGPGAQEYAYPVQAWSLGGLDWLALGGEVVVDYALRLRRESARPLWVFGYSTDVMAYIPNERVLREGRYEGETSMIYYGRPSPWAPGLEEKIVTQAGAALERARMGPTK